MNKPIEKFRRELYSMLEYCENYADSQKFIIATNYNNGASPLVTKYFVEDEYMNVDDIITEIKNFIRLLEVPDEEFIKNRELFQYFDFLSSYMRFAKLDDREIYKIFNFFIERNIKSVQTELYAIDIEKLRKLDFRTMTHKELDGLIKAHKIPELLNADPTTLTGIDLNRHLELSACSEYFMEDLREFISNHEKYKTNAIECYSNITMENIVDVAAVLSAFNIEPFCYIRMIRFLLKKYIKNLQRSTSTVDLDLCETYLEMLTSYDTIKDIGIPVTHMFRSPSENLEEGANLVEEAENLYTGTYQQYYKLLVDHNERINNLNNARKNKPSNPKPAQTYLTEKEARALKHNIRKYWDSYNASLIKAPSITEIFELVSAMKLYGHDKYEIKRMLSSVIDRCVFTPVLDENNQLVKYVQSYDDLIDLVFLLITYNVEKAKVYEVLGIYLADFKCEYENPVLNSYANLDRIKLNNPDLASNIDKTLKEMFICSDEDYKLGKSILDEYLKEASKYDRNVDYEYKVAASKVLKGQSK